MSSSRSRPVLLVALLLLAAVAAFAFLKFSSTTTEEPLALNEPASISAAPTVPDEVATPLEPAAPESADPNADGEPKDGSTRTLAASERLELEVIAADLTPIAGAQVALWRDDTLLHAGTTDAAGLAVFPSATGTANVLVRVSGWDALKSELELAAGRRRLELPAFARVAGHVLVDGGAPPEGFALTWTPMKRAKSTQDLPNAVQKALARAVDPKASALGTSCDANGGFRFDRIPPGSAGSLGWQGPYAPEGSRSHFANQQFAVPEPREDVELRLQSALLVRLRVVDPQGAPIGGAVVTMRRETKQGSGSRSSMTSLGANAEGVATTLLSGEAFDTLTFEVGTKDGSGMRSHAFPWPTQTRGVWDLGDLPVLATHAVAVTVRDESGAPIQGARAYPWPSSHRRDAGKSDAEGRLSVQVPVARCDIAVEAFGYVSIALPIEPEQIEVVATLRRTCLLTFEIAGAVPKRSNLNLELRGPRDMFEDRFGPDQERPPSIRTLSDGWSASSDDKGDVFETEPEKGGIWRIGGLKPGLAFHARLMGSGAVLAELDVPPLAPGEQRKLSFTIGDVGRTLSLRVLSPAGEPLPQASAAVLDDDSSYRSLSANDQGVIELPALFGERCLVRVSAGAFASRVVQFSPIPSGVVDVRLEQGRSVEVELVDTSGAPFTGKSTVRPEWRVGGGASSQLVAPGRYRLDCLPAGLVPIEIYGESIGVITRLHDTAVPFVRVVIGGKGSVTCNVKRSESALGPGCAVAVGLPGAAEPLSRSHLDPRDVEGWAQFAGLLDGDYEVWLERRDPDAPDERWLRSGTPKAVKLDAEHQAAQVEFTLE